MQRFAVNGDLQIWRDLHLLFVIVGVLMANPSKLLSAYERMVAAEEEKHRLMPERLVTLMADKSWIKAVSKHIGARQAFLDAAHIQSCRSEAVIGAYTNGCVGYSSSY